MSASPVAIIRHLGHRDYAEVWSQMSEFTNTRDADTPNEIWLVEHPPVFTQGQAGKPEHILVPSDIPLIKTDRGGQVTFHGPGQLVIYPLLNLKQLKLGVRDLVSRIEASVVEFLAGYGVESAAKPDAPGVYVEGKKIASLGLRVRRGCSFHGVAINIDADLSPFQQINPCGYAGLEMVNLSALVAENKILDKAFIESEYSRILCRHLELPIQESSE